MPKKPPRHHRSAKASGAPPAPPPPIPTAGRSTSASTARGGGPFAPSFGNTRGRGAFPQGGRGRGGGSFPTAPPPSSQTPGSMHPLHPRPAAGPAGGPAFIPTGGSSASGSGSGPTTGGRMANYGPPIIEDYYTKPTVSYSWQPPDGGASGTALTGARSTTSQTNAPSSINPQSGAMRYLKSYGDDRTHGAPYYGKNDVIHGQWGSDSEDEGAGTTETLGTAKSLTDTSTGNKGGWVSAEEYGRYAPFQSTTPG